MVLDFLYRFICGMDNKAGYGLGFLIRLRYDLIKFGEDELSFC